MLRSILLFLITSGLFYQVDSSKQKEPPQPYDVGEAYEVYAAVLPSEWPVQVADVKRVLIRAETSRYTMCLKPDLESEKIIGPAIADYVNVNKKTWLLKKAFSLEKPYELIHVGQTGGWDRRYPDSVGWIELSAVGFNADKSIAVVYAGHICGNLCGDGTFHVLQKKDAKWQPLSWRGSTCEWVS